VQSLSIEPLTVQATSEPILRFESVSKAFQGKIVLSDLTLEMRHGEFLTLLGPSGCGKTTSLNLVAGLIQPDAGTIFLRGQPANQLPPRRRGLGLVFQSWALFPHLNVFDNIAYGLEVRSVPAKEIDGRVGDMLDVVRLPGVAEMFPSQLSGGMQQRVALARALVTRPDLLLLDEPLSNLDAALRKEMQIELRRIHSELCVSTLLVTHSQEEALVMSDRIAVMRSGRIECIDTPHLVYNRPPTRFVCTFVGEANILECEVEAVAQGEATLRRGALRFAIEAPPDVCVGQRLAAAIRPENIVMAPWPATTEAAGTAAVVLDAVFKGSNISYWVAVGDERLHVLTLPPLEGHAFAPGDRVRVTLPKNRIILLERGHEPHA
jgi:ABC-type Fe3+/spermidine/putrescine transport system ATPase subunit